MARNQKRVTLRAQWLGRMLRTLREEQALTLKDAAEYLQKDFSSVSKFELGTFPIRRGDVFALMDLYGVEDPRKRDTLLQLAGEVWQTGWWEKYAQTDIWGPTIDLVWLESRAVAIRQFSATVVPGLLQTREYAAKLVDVVNADSPAEQRETWVDLRIGRQRIIGDNLERFTAVLDESVLQRPVGDTAAFRRQLQHLRELGERQDVEVRVLPFSAGAHPSPEGGFSLLRLEEPFPEIAHVESPGGAMYLERGEAERLVGLYDRLESLALSAGDSRELLQAKSEGVS